jgi:hypothetical protein
VAPIAAYSRSRDKAAWLFPSFASAAARLRKTREFSGKSWVKLCQRIAVALGLILIVSIGGSLLFLPERHTAACIGGLRTGLVRNREESDQKSEGSNCKMAHVVS